jgi:hypothetical protein
MSVPLDALIPAGAAVFGSAVVYAGTRLTSRRTQDTETRKVNLAEFETFKKAYYERIAEFEKRYETQERKMNTVERLLRLALLHIRDLRADMRQHDVIPTHTTPPELETLLWTLTDDEPVTNPAGPGE